VLQILSILYANYFKEGAVFFNAGCNKQVFSRKTWKKLA